MALFRSSEELRLFLPAKTSFPLLTVLTLPSILLELLMLLQVIGTTAELTTLLTFISLLPLLLLQISSTATIPSVESLLVMLSVMFTLRRRPCVVEGFRGDIDKEETGKGGLEDIKDTFMGEGKEDDSAVRAFKNVSMAAIGEDGKFGVEDEVRGFKNVSIVATGEAGEYEAADDEEGGEEKNKGKEDVVEGMGVKGELGDVSEKEEEMEGIGSYSVTHEVETSGEDEELDTVRMSGLALDAENMSSSALCAVKSPVRLRAFFRACAILGFSTTVTVRG